MNPDGHGRGIAVTLDGIRVTLSGVPVVDGVDLDVGAGEFLGVVGPNGSGKSTLLATLYRALRPRSGTTHLGDEDLGALSVRESATRVAAVVQHSGLPGGMTVREVVELGRTPHRSTRRADHLRAVDHALEVLDLHALADRTLATLSGGQRQRADIARALAQEPGVLVLDEITNHLDVRTRFDILDLLCGLDVTVIAVLHELDLAVRYCDRIAVLDRGRVVAAGAPLDALSPRVFEEVFRVSARADRGSDGVVRIRFD